MSTAPPLPERLVPPDWSDEQAFAVWQRLNELLEVIWQHYEAPISKRLGPDPTDLYDEPDLNQFDLFDPDDELPF